MAAPTKRCTFDGMSDGTALTTASQTSTSGDQISTLSGGAGNTKTARTSAAVRGTAGLELVGNGVSSFISYTFTAVAAASCELYLDHDSSANLPSVDVTILQFRNTGGTGPVSAVLKTTGVIAITNAAASVLVNLNSNTALPTGKYRLWLGATVGTTTSNGTIAWELTDNAGNVINNSSNTATNSGTTNYNEARYGKTGPSGNLTMNIDEVAYRDTDMTLIDFQTNNINYTTNDPVGITDSVSYTLTRVINVSDNVSIIDPGSDSLSDRVATVDDALGITDSALAPITRGVNLDDAIGITDTVTSDQNKSVSLSESIGITDSLTQAANKTVQFDDGVAIQDAAITTVNIPVYVTLTDTVGITDTVTYSVARVLNVSITDAVGITDFVSNGAFGATSGPVSWLARQYHAFRLGLTATQATQKGANTLYRDFLKQELGTSAELSLGELKRSWALSKLAMTPADAANMNTDYLLRQQYANELALSGSVLASLSDTDLYIRWLNLKLGL